jgi:hypothetical protein
MDLHIDIELQGGLLLVTATGRVKFDAVVRLLKEVCDTAAANQINKILVNGLAADGELASFERYASGVEIAAYLTQRRMNVRLAFVGVPPTVNGFGVLVAQNRGVDAMVFPTSQEALTWLDDVPGDPSIGQKPL